MADNFERFQPEIDAYREAHKDLPPAPPLNTAQNVVEPSNKQLAELGTPPASTPGKASPTPAPSIFERVRAAIAEGAPAPGGEPPGADPIAVQIAAEQRGEVQPAFPPATVPVDSLAQEIAAEQKREDGMQAQLMRWRAEHDSVDPTRRAEVLRYAAATGLTPDLVDQNLDAVRQKVDAAGVSWPLVVARQPALKKFLLEAPSVTPLVKDDVANLSGLEWLLKAPYHAFRDALGEQALVYHQFLEAEGLGGEDNRRDIRELEASFSGKDYGAKGLLQSGVVGLARAAPFVAGDIAARVLGGFIGAGIAGETGAAAGGAAGAPAGGVGAAPGAVAGGVAGGLTGGAVGQFTGSALFNYYESLGPLYWRLSQIRDTHGQPLDPDLVEAVAQAGAMVNGALFAGFFGKVGTSIPGVKQLLERVGASAVEKTLAQETLRSAVGRTLKTYGTTLAHGALTMAAQSAVNSAAEEGAKALSGQDVEAHWANVGAAAGDGLKAGIEDMWLLTAIGPGREMLREVGRARRSSEGAAKLEAMTEAARSSKLLEKFPQGFQEALRRMKAAKGAVQSVFVPVEEWTRYWQDQKVDPGEIAAEVVGDGGKAFADAVANKSDLVIPVENYLAKLARTEHAKGLAPDVRLYQDDLTPRERQAEEKRISTRMEQDEKARGGELDEGRRAVYDVIRQQAEGAGIPKADADANAQVVADFARTMALRMGVSVQEAASLGALGKLRILGPKGEAAAAGARAAFERFLSPEASQLLADRLSSMDTEARAREMFSDPVTGLLHRRAFNALPAREGKQIAVLTTTDIKPVNDAEGVGGHDVGNDLLRAIGKELGAVDPEASRSGTNFLFHVDSPEQLQEVVARVKAALPSEHLNIEAATGENVDAAFKALDTQTEEGRASGRISPRGQPSAGLDIGGLKFTGEKANLEVPASLQERVAGLSDKEFFGQLYVEPKTGALTREGWEGIPRKAHVAAFDLKGLKLTNKLFGDEVGDRMLARFGEVARHFGGGSFDFAHLSGDEYAAQHSDPEMLQRFVQRLTEELPKYPLDGVKDLATGKAKVIRLRFRYGFGKGSYLEADRDLNRRKAAEGGSGGDHAGGIGGEPGTVRREQGPVDGGRGGPAEPGHDGRAGQAGDQPGVPAGEVGAAEVLDPSAGGRGVRTGPDGSSGPGQHPPREADARAGVPPGDGGRSGSDRRDLRPVPGGALADAGGGGGADQAGPFSGRGASGQRFPEVVAHLEGAAVHFKEGGAGEGPRGEIRLQLEPGGRPVAFDIRVLQGDRSTLAHETAHFLSWSLHEIATSDLASSDIRKDYGTLLRWAGYSSPEERVALTRERAELARKVGQGEASDADRTRLKALSAKEERISHGWEQYLAEGKTPGEGLARVFSRFKKWMDRIYSGLPGIQAQFRDKYGEELQLSDEVRGVFSRMLATDEAITEASQDIGLATPSRDVLETLSPEEREAHRQALVEARLTAEQEVARRAAEIDEQRVGEERARIEAEVTAQVDSEQVFRAMRYLQRGELADGTGEVKSGNALPEGFRDAKGQPLKLNRVAFVEKFGADLAREMPAGIFDRTKRGGETADTLALLLGYDSGEELVAAFRKAEPREALIEKQTQERLDALYGPALKLMSDAAMAAVHNDAAAHAILLENRGLARRVNPAAARRVEATSLDTLKETAARIVGETPVSELNPDRYARAERRAALKAAELWGRGKKEESLDFREARLLNHVLYRAARDAKERLEKSWEKLHGTSEDKKDRMGKADPSYRDVHAALLEAVGIVPPAENSEGRLGLDAALERARQDSEEMDFDVDAIRRLLARPRAWESLTADEAQNVVDAATNIEVVARRRLELVLAGKRETRDGWFSDFEAHLRRRKPLPLAPLSRTAEGLADKTFKLGRGAAAVLTDTETLAHLLDAGDREGPAHRLLLDGRLEARAKEAELAQSVLAKISEAWEDVPKEIRKLQGQKLDLAELLPAPPGSERLIAPVHTRDSLWMLFLNWAHEDGRQRVRDGMGWTDANVEKALAMLSEPELDYLQGVLNSIESLYPELARVYEGRTGRRLGKVKAAPMTINGKEYAGGYWVLRYDSRLSRPGEVQAEDAIAALFQPNYIRPTAPSGHTKSRVKRVSAPVDLSWSIVPAHFAQVIHDIAYGDWVRQVGGIVLDRRFKDLVTEYFGAEQMKEVVPWLRDVANARADSAAGSTAEILKVGGAFARSRMAAAVLAYNFPNVLQGLMDPWNAQLDGQSWRYTASAYRQVLSPWNWGRMPELAQSTELAYRKSHYLKNLRETFGETGPARTGLMHDVTETGFRLYDIVDGFSARVTFKAGFDQAMAEGRTEAEAIRFGDDMVRRRFISHDVAEKAPILRTKSGIAAVLMFHSYANKQFNSLRRLADDAYLGYTDEAATAGDRAAIVATVAAKLIAFGLVGAAGTYLAGRGPKQDEDTEKWLAERVLLEPFNTLPFAGAALERLLLGQRVSVRSAPELALLEDTFNRIGALARGDKSAQEAALLALDSLLFLSGGPSAQVHRTLEGATHLVGGQVEPRGPVGAAGALFYGDRKNQPRNPLSDIQRAINE